MPEEELVQKSNEDIAHFIQRVVEKWEKQGKIAVDGKVLAEIKEDDKS